MADKFPSYVKAYQYKGGFNKFVYDKIKELCGESEEPTEGNPQVPAQEQEEQTKTATVTINVTNSVATTITFSNDELLDDPVVKTTGQAGGGSVELPVGSYSIAAEATGFKKYTSEGFAVEEGGSTLEITLEQEE